MLLLSGTDKRDPNYPGIPTLKEIGCKDVSSAGYIVVGPKGIPEDIAKKLDLTFNKVTGERPFQEVLGNFDVPYDYLDHAQLGKKIAVDYEWYKTYLKKLGAKKEE